MINQSKIKMVKATDVVYYVECVGHDSDGKPQYRTQGAFYLGSYLLRKRLIHIVTLGDLIDTCVVRHVPDSRIFDTLAAAYSYVVKLVSGVVEYER